MEDDEVRDYFCNIIKQDEDVAVGVAAVKTLMEVIKKSPTLTVQGLDEDLKQAIRVMKECNYPIGTLISGCEIFRRFITLAQLDTDTFEECRNILLTRGNIFVHRLNNAGHVIAKSARIFIKPNHKILTHSMSRVVLKALIYAKEQGIPFEVFVTISEPDKAGLRMCKELEKEGIQCIPILDASVAHVMAQIDIVLLGAESACESGGILNKIGSYSVAIAAKENKKRLYVLVEFFKFARIFPLNNLDIPPEYRFVHPEKMTQEEMKKATPLVDYTPAAYITLIITDMGIFSTDGVTDEFIKLYT